MIPFLFLLACADGESVDTPVRATLDDGQILYGAVATDTLRLVGGWGEVAVPLGDVGEVAPVEGGALGGSGNFVSVWLRDGSELRGQWAEPELAMDIEIAHETVGIDLPVARLERFQLAWGDELPATIVYRVHTVYGDDFLADPEATRIPLTNELGTFAPTLAEIASLEPIGEATGPWRMALTSGTVLVGPLGGETVHFALPMGPQEITVAVADLVQIARQDWGGYRADSAPPIVATPGNFDSGGGAQAVEAAAEGWFDNRSQSSFKSAL